MKRVNHFLSMLLLAFVALAPFGALNATAAESAPSSAVKSQEITWSADVHASYLICIDGNSAFNARPNNGTVLNIIQNSPDHTILATAVGAAGLGGALSADGTLTVFAPTDAAFQALPPGTIEAVLADVENLLTPILLYHVLGSTVLSTDLMDGQTAVTLNGQEIFVTINADGVFINDAQVTVADIIADNGVVHVIDAVLIPEAPATNTVWDVILNSPDHFTLTAAVLAAGLDDALSADGTLTVFAPTDAAFNALPAGTVPALLEDVELLTSILLYHVVGSTALSTDLSNGQVLTTLNGADVIVTINADGVFINDAEVTVADIVADNGVVHVIDAVLIPAEPEPCVDFEGGPYNDFNTTFGGAPVPNALGECPVNQITAFEAWASEAYSVNGFIAGTEYNFSICEGPSAGAWPVELTILDATNNVVASAVDCQITWTAPANGTYLIVINEAGACGTSTNTQTDNGYPTLTCTGSVLNTVWNIILNSDVHNTLETAVLAAGLDGALTSGESLTVFAPTDAAFAALPAGTLEALLADPEGALTQVLLYHVLGSTVLSSELSNGQVVTTLNGQDVTVTINAEGVFINDAQVIVADIVADNGVVHVIDAVLVPTEVAPCTTFVGGPYTNFNSLFGGAPVPNADGSCPVNQITTFEVWASEAYTVNGFVAGTEYTFSICDGPGAGTWDPELIVLSSTGEIIATAEGCTITWTSPADGTYIIGINEVGACGSASTNTQVDNGFPTLTCTGTTSLTVWDVIVNSDVHNTLEAAVLAANLNGALSADGTLTVFAPTDAAFAALPAGTVEALLADPAGDLTQILLYHVLGATVLSSDLSNGQTAVTLQGQSVTVTINANGVFINDARVTVADIVTDNGVVHVIDAVLLPNLISTNEVSNAFGGVSIFPNPASSVVYVDLSRLTKAAERVRLVDMMGRQVRDIVVDSDRLEVQTNDLPVGTYIFEFMIEGAIFHSKLSVNR